MTYNQQLFDSQIEHLLNTKRYQEATRLLIEKAGVRHRSLLGNMFRKQDKLAITREVEDEVKRYGQELLSTGKNSIADYLGAGAVSLMICRDLANIGTSLVNVQFTRKLSEPGVRLYNGTCMLHCVLASATTATFFNGEVVIQEK